MRLAPHSLRWRLTLWYSLVLSVLLAAGAIGSWYTLRTVLASRADRFLSDARDAFLVELDAERATAATTEDAIAAALHDIRFSDIEFVVLDSAHRVVATSWTRPGVGGPRPEVAGARLAPARLVERVLAAPTRSTAPGTSTASAASARAPEEAPAAPPTPRTRLLTVGGESGGHRVALAAPVTLDGTTYTVAAVQARRWLHETLSEVTLAYLTAIPAFLLLAAGGGYLLARRALAPVAEMGRRARAIEAHSLHERLPVEDPRDELGGLATVVNDLLRRLERSFLQQRRLVADASHELRTPVAVVRAEADVALSRPSRPEEEYREALGVIQDAGGRMSRIVEDLFLLARADDGVVPRRDEPIYLDELVDDTVRVLRVLASQRGVRIDVAPPPAELPVRGDPDLLGRLLLNLLENAVKYSTAGSTVSVRLDRSGGSAVLTVSDEGPGIPAEAQARVFERFFRAHAASTTGEPAPVAPAGGAGLGLAIAKWVAEAHGGSLALVHSSSAGSTFRVTLPLDPSAPLGD